MEGMRTLLRNSLARSLRTLSEEDRLAAALPVVCGSALAAHCAVVELDRERTLHLRVSNADWLGSLLGMRDVLLRDLARVAGVPLDALDLQTAPSPVSRLKGGRPMGRPGTVGRSTSPQPSRSPKSLKSPKYPRSPQERKLH